MQLLACRSDEEYEAWKASPEADAAMMGEKAKAGMKGAVRSLTQ